jgi:heptosyltransferase II
MGFSYNLTNSAMFAMVSFLELFRSKKKKEIKEPKKILVLAYSGVGNIILGVSIFEQLKGKYPNCQISVMATSKVSVQLLKNIKEVSDAFFIKAKGLGFFIELSKHRKKYDTVICMFPAGILGAISGYFLGAKQVIGHEYNKGFCKKSGLFYTHAVKLEAKHDVYTNLDLLKLFRIDQKKPDLSIPLSKEEERFGIEYINKNNIKRPIGIHCGSNSNQKWKRWDISNFIGVANLLENKGYDPIFFLGQDEQEYLSEIKENKFHCVTGTGILETASIIRQCKKFISNDSGLMHLAVSQGVKTYGILGPTDHVRTGPFGNTIIRTGLSCSPCYNIMKPFKCTNKEKMKCLKGLDVERVFKEIMQ